MATLLTNLKNLVTRPVALAEDVKTTGPPRGKEIGGTGTSVFGSIVVQNEYNPKLKGSAGLDIYEQMGADGQVQGMLQFTMLPIRTLPMTIEPASDEGIDVEIAEFVENCYKEYMSITWDDYLRHVLKMLQYGFAPFEKVWKNLDGKWVWRKLAPRLPQSVTKITVDEAGGLAGIQQRASVGGKFATVDIPVEKLVVFVNEREGSDYYGKSILRGAYKHWWMKDGYYKADAIAHERLGGGSLLITAPDEVMDNTSEVTELKGQAESFRSHAKSYILKREGVVVDVVGMKSGSMPDSTPHIKEHNQQISSCMLMNFMDLGRTESGSRATAGVQSDPAYLSLKSIVGNIEDTNNRYCIKQLVDYNFPNVTEYPHMVFGDLSSADATVFSQSIAQLMNSGGLTYDPDLENWIRKTLDADEMPEELYDRKLETMKNPPVIPPAFGVKNDSKVPPRDESDRSSSDTQQDKENATTGLSEGFCSCEDDSAAFKLADGFTSWREPTEMELKYMALKEIDQRLDRGEEDVVSAIAETVKIQRSNLVAEATKILNTKDDKKFDEKLDRLGMPKLAEMRRLMVAELKDIYAFGREQVKEERRRQGVKLADDPRYEPTEGDLESLRYLRKKAKYKVDGYSSAILAGLTFTILEQRKAGRIDTMAISTLIDEMQTRQSKKAALNLVSDAWNMGRATETTAGVSAGAEISECIYTAILDKNRCRVCDRANNVSVKYGSAEYQDMTPPLNSRQYGTCLGYGGGGRCRCAWLILYSNRGQ